MPLLARRSLTLADAKNRRSRAVAWVKDHPFAVEFAEIDLGFELASVGEGESETRNRRLEFVPLTLEPRVDSIS